MSPPRPSRVPVYATPAHIEPPGDSPNVHDQLSVAREAVQRASDTTEKTDVRDQLQSIDEGMADLTDTDDPEEFSESIETDRVEQIEEKIDGLVEETDDETGRELEEARDAIEVFREEHGQMDA